MPLRTGLCCPRQCLSTLRDKGFVAMFWMCAGSDGGACKICAMTDGYIPCDRGVHRWVAEGRDGEGHDELSSKGEWLNRWISAYVRLNSDLKGLFNPGRTPQITEGAKLCAKLCGMCVVREALHFISKGITSWNKDYEWGIGGALDSWYWYIWNWTYSGMNSACRDELCAVPISQGFKATIHPVDLQNVISILTRWWYALYGFTVNVHLNYVLRIWSTFLSPRAMSM